MNDPEATASTIDAEGWLHTGDIGYVDDDYEIFIVDRVKELIKFKGFQACLSSPEFVPIISYLYVCCQNIFNSNAWARLKFIETLFSNFQYQ